MDKHQLVKKKSSFCNHRLFLFKSSQCLGVPCTDCVLAVQTLARSKLAQAVCVCLGVCSVSVCVVL